MLVALHLVLGREILSPPRLGPGDQWGYLGNARALAGSGPDWVLPNFPYFTFGYSLALAPVHVLLDDPESLFLGIRLTNALLTASVLPLLYLLCRMVLRSSPRDAIVAAVAGSLVPPLIAHSSSALSENLVLPLCIAAALACHAMLRDGPWWRRIWFGPCVALLFATHNRFLLTVPLALVVLGISAVTRRSSRGVAAINAVLLVAGLVGVVVVRSALVDSRWVAGIETPQGPASDALDILTDVSLLGSYLLEVVGQLWYIGVGTAGLAVLGIVVLARRTELASDRVAGPWARLRGVANSDGALTSCFLLTSALGVLLVSSYFFTRVLNGTEGYIAGRHNDSFTPIWVAAAVTYLLAEQSRQAVLRTLVGVMAFVVVVSAVLIGVRDGSDWEGLVSPLNAPAVSFYGVSGRLIVLIPTVIAIGALLLFAIVRLAGQTPALVLPLGLALVVGVSTDIEPDPTYAEWTMPEDFAALNIDRAAIVQARGSGMPLYYQYFAPDLEVVPWGGTGDPPEPIVVAAIDDVGLAERGARLVLIDEGVIQGFRPPYSMGVWAMPGPELRRFRRAGMLLRTPPATVSGG